MSQASQAESPVLVRSIEDNGAELVGRFYYVALVRNRPRTLGTPRASPLRVKELLIAARNCSTATASGSQARAWLSASRRNSVRLQHDQTVGILAFVSDDWSFVELVSIAQAVLSGWEGRSLVRAQLGLHRSLYRLRSGMVLPYTRPVIAISGGHCSFPRSAW
jgi:hypothetical protein